MNTTGITLPPLPSPENRRVLPDYNSGQALRAFLEGRGLAVRKQWGQHFLINPRARLTIVSALEAESGDAVWEIGGGPGSMTAELLSRGMKVKAFEIDPGFCALLEDLFAPEKEAGRFSLVRGDALKTWKNAAAEEAALPVPYLLGNLPYTVAALLMGNLIEGGRLFTRIAVTVQKETALRMAALPGSKDYSSISVLCASAYQSRIIMTLKGPSFYPVPRVESAVIRFDRRGTPPPPLFYPLVRALFASRRKTAANNLEHFLAASVTLKKRAPVQNTRDIAAAALEQCGIGGGERAERLPPEAFAELAAALEQCGIGGGERDERNFVNGGTD